MIFIYLFIKEIYIAPFRHAPKALITTHTVRLCVLIVCQLYPVYTMKQARRAGSTSARRALVVRS